MRTSIPVPRCTPLRWRPPGRERCVAEIDRLTGHRRRRRRRRRRRDRGSFGRHRHRAARSLPTAEVPRLAQRGVRGRDRGAAQRQGRREFTFAGQRHTERYPPVVHEQADPIGQRTVCRPAVSGVLPVAEIPDKRTGPYRTRDHRSSIAESGPIESGQSVRQACGGRDPGQRMTSRRTIVWSRPGPTPMHEMPRPDSSSSRRT